MAVDSSTVVQRTQHGVWSKVIVLCELVSVVNEFKLYTFLEELPFVV